MSEAEAAIKANEQARAAALVYTYGKLGNAPRPVFDLLLRYAVSEDGALHAEKFYRTASEEFAAAAPGLPLAATDRPRPRDRERIRPSRRRLCRSL